MKKRLFAFMILMCASCAFAGFPAAAEEEQSTEASEDNLLAELEEANTLDALVARNGRINCTFIWYYADGTEEYTLTEYQDDALFLVENSAGTFWVYENGDIYGHELDSEGSEYLFRILLVGDDAYENYLEDHAYTGTFWYDESEQMRSEEIADGLIYLETSWSMTEEEIEYFADYLGVAEEEVECLSGEYVIDEESMEILEAGFYVSSGEEKILDYEIILNRDPEEQTVDEDLYESVFGEDTYTLTAITDAGTEDETVYTQTAAKGVHIHVRHGDEFEDAIYADPECTEELTESELDYTADLTVYLKRVEE